MILKIGILAIAALIVNAAPQKFIINGSVAPNRVPSYAVIVHTPSISGGHIITNWHVLTAGHVIHGSPIWLVGVGSNNFEELNIIVSNEGIIHPEYSSQPRQNDIGILLLRRSIEYDASVQPITLPEPGLYMPFVNEQGHIHGFGWSSDSSDMNTMLHVAFKRVIDPAICAQHYTIQPESQFCAADSINSSNICYGDLGGGFITFKMGVPVLVGIASMTVELCSSTYPAAYTRVSHYLSWINQVVNV